MDRIDEVKFQREITQERKEKLKEQRERTARGESLRGRKAGAKSDSTAAGTATAAQGKRRMVGCYGMDDEVLRDDDEDQDEYGGYTADASRIIVKPPAENIDILMQFSER